MQGIGVDIVEFADVRKARFLARVAEFILSGGEQSEFRASADRVQFLASRMAAKEAVIKAFPHPISFQDFEVRKNAEKPVIYFFDSSHRAYRVLVSISHSQEHAVGMASVA